MSRPSLIKRHKISHNKVKNILCVVLHFAETEQQCMIYVWSNWAKCECSLQGCQGLGVRTHVTGLKLVTNWERVIQKKIGVLLSYGEIRRVWL